MGSEEALGTIGDGALVERECLLFEAGDYPDRGVTITPDDLAAIARNTEGALPVRIEHLRESPFDGALGIVTRLRAVGNRLWGTLRQPAEAWEFARKAGARALSVALDVASRKLTEVSFVCRPRIAAAQVFASGEVRFQSEEVFDPTEDEGRTTDEEEDQMTSIRQFAEGLMGYLRGVVGADGGGSGDALASERAALEARRQEIQERDIEQRLLEFKRQGQVRATEEAERIARAILRFGVTNVIQFAGDEMPLARLFAQFLAANGAVVPMGEWAAAGAHGGGAADRLISLSRESARRDGIPYLAAFSQVSSANPDLARAAREEGFGGS